MPNSKTETATPERAETEMAELLAEYYCLAEPERGGDFLWQLSERFESGKPLGWFVEHEGDVCQLDPFGEDGPHPTRAAAVQRMTEHLLPRSSACAVGSGLERGVFVQQPRGNASAGSSCAVT